MKISPYINIERIEFVVTYHCTGRCLHCSEGDMLNYCRGGHHVLGEKAAEAIRRLKEMFPVTSVMTFGGEPLLYTGEVCSIHRAAADAGIAQRSIITNGYFSRDYETIRRTAAQLAGAGVNHLLLSVDAFHHQSIPFEPVYHFAEEAKRCGLNIKLHPAWVVNRDHDNPYNACTRELLERFAGLDIPIGNGNDIFMAGNAAKNLTEYYPEARLDMNQKCGEMPYSVPPTEVTSVSIVPNGDVNVCSFAIGNIYREKIEDIVARYDPFADETMCAAMNGAEAMLALAEKQGIDIDISKCYSVCDICRQLNRK